MTARLYLSLSALSLILFRLILKPCTKADEKKHKMI